MKKILALSLAILMLVPAFATVCGAERLIDSRDQIDRAYTLGDANADGAVNALDANAVKAHTVNGTAVVTDAADLNADGTAGARDVLYYKTVFAGIRSLSELDSGNIVHKFTIGGNDIASFDLVIPADAQFYKSLPGDENYDVQLYSRADSDNCTFAAELFSETVSKLTGVSVDIVRGEKMREHGIFFHTYDWTSDEAAELSLGKEDYIYRVTDGDMHIYSTVRGSMYAVYEMLEKYLGVSFYTEKYTYYKTLRTVDIPEGTDVYHHVELEFRYSGQNAQNNWIRTYYYARKFNGTQIYGNNCLRYGYQTGPLFDNAHSFGDYYLMGAGYDPGPDYDPPFNRLYGKWKSRVNENTYPFNDIRMNRWQPCASPDVTATLDTEYPSDYAYMFQGMIEALQMMKDWGNNVELMTEMGVHIASASINDNGNSCACTLCAAKANGTKTKMRRNFSNMLVGYTGDYEITKEGNTEYVTFKKESYSGVYLDLTKRFAKDIQDYYPGLRVLTIIYDHTVPESVRPNDKVVLVYCGHSCNQHVLGSGECKNLTTLGSNNTHDETELKAWADFCHNAGTTIWFWEYGVNYHYDLAPCPNVMDFWGNLHYILDYCGCDGLFYEGCDFYGEGRNDGEEQNFENLKSYMAGEMAWNPHMTYDEFVAVMKDWLYKYYGDGYEYIFDFIQYQQAAGDDSGTCFIVNYDRPWEMYGQNYIRAHYEEARACLDRAFEMAKTDFQRHRVECLYLTCDFLGLSACYDEMYTDGTAEQRAVFEERYTHLLEFIWEYEIKTFGDEDVYPVPDEIDFTVNPMIQFYDHGSNRGITP